METHTSPDESALPPRKKARTVVVTAMQSSDTAAKNGDAPPVQGIDNDGAAGDADESVIASGSAFASVAGCSPGISRTELIRIMTQELQTLGYRECAALLERQSGVPCEPPETIAFKQAIMDGKWDNAIQLLEQLNILPENIKVVTFALLERKYLEFLEARKLMEALHCLREELSPLDYNVDRLHTLSGLIMCKDLSSASKELGWNGSGAGTRARLLQSLEPLVPTSMLVPERRLEKLVTQALEFQRHSNYYHNTPHAQMSLLTDYKSSRDDIPRHCSAVLRHHSDEVWHIAFSNCGRWLASASKDNTAAIWDVQQKRVVHELHGHCDAVYYLAWSADDKHLLTCGSDECRSVKMWDVETGRLIRDYPAAHSEGVTACAWRLDGQSFVTGSTDQNLNLFSINGTLLHTWKRVRTCDMAMTPDGNRLIVACHAKKIRIFNLVTKEEESFDTTASIISLSLSSDGLSALLSLSSEEIHVWDMTTRKVVNKYTGHKQGRYAIRSSFGGYQDGFIVSGSEDNCVYLWHRRSQSLLEVLEGHSDTINSVAWHPSNYKMMASASDDKTIRIWTGLQNNEPQDVSTNATNGQGQVKNGGIQHQRLIAASEC